MFAVHPVHTEAVTSVVGRAELLSALFVLAGLLAHQRRATLAAVLFIEFAHFCKETGLLGFPLMIWMDSALELPESTGRTQRECLTGRCRRWAGLLFVMSANIGARYWLLDGKTLPSFTKIDNPLWFQPRFADQLFATVRVHMEYARLLIFPDRLSCDYSLQCIVSCDSSFCQATAVTLYATVFFAFAWVSSLQLCRCCAYASQRSVLPSHVRWTVPVFAIGFAAISLVPAAHFFKVGLLVAERLLYTPSMGTCLFVGWLLSRVAIGTAEKLQRSCWRRCAVGLLASNILVVCIVRCIARNEEWATPDELYISAVHTCPTSECCSTLSTFNVAFYCTERSTEQTILLMCTMQAHVFITILAHGCYGSMLSTTRDTTSKRQSMQNQIFRWLYTTLDCPTTFKATKNKQ
eukprot:SAG31_NODE_659_length_13095_cov_4.439597_7_plen_407_part_00